ncbi:hypothetical protein HDV02_003994 [Globomyces sp. JEL0801]|nr:hypothetical protein HDV02_003994 [Globomyces sp. JEL0801]
MNEASSTIPKMNERDSIVTIKRVKKKNGDGYYEYQVDEKLRKRRNNRQLNMNKKLTRTMNKSLEYLSKLERSFGKKRMAKSIKNLREKGFCLIPVQTTAALELEIKGLLESVANGSIRNGIHDGDDFNIQNKFKSIVKLLELEGIEYEHQDIIFECSNITKELKFKRMNQTTNINKIPTFYVTFAVEEDTRLWVCPKSHNTKKKILLPGQQKKKGQRICELPEEITIPKYYALIQFANLLVSRSKNQNNLRICDDIDDIKESFYRDRQ